jgi:hypothetical protein
VETDLRDQRSHGERRQRFNPRFAGEAFQHAYSKTSEGTPTLRRLTSEVQWKRPPSSNINAEISV